jgi:hypothetical protein
MINNNKVSPSLSLSFSTKIRPLYSKSHKLRTFQKVLDIIGEDCGETETAMNFASARYRCHEQAS